MLSAYLGNSSRSKQFVREFLDRRHTCWQMHRKRLEEMQNELNSKQQGSSDQQSSSAPTEGSAYLTKAYSEANDSQADSVVFIFIHSFPPPSSTLGSSCPG